MNFTLTTNELTPQRAPMSEKNDSINEEIIKTVLDETIDLVVEEAEPKSQDVPEAESSQSMDTLATTYVPTTTALKRAKTIVDNVEPDYLNLSDFTSDEDSVDIGADILTELGSPISKKYVVDGEEITIGKKRERNGSEITHGSPRIPTLTRTNTVEPISELLSPSGFVPAGQELLSPTIDYTITDGMVDTTPLLPYKKRKVGRFVLFQTDIRMASDESVKNALGQLQAETKRRADNRV